MQQEDAELVDAGAPRYGQEADQDADRRVTGPNLADTGAPRCGREADQGDLRYSGNYRQEADPGDLRYPGAYRREADPGVQTRELLRALTRTRRQLSTPTFDGKGDVLQFVEQFTDVATLNDCEEPEAFFRLKTALSGAATRGINDCTDCDEILERLQVRFKLSETGAAQLLKALEWSPKEDAYKFTDYVQTLLRIAYPEMDDDQVIQRSIKEIRQALPDQSQTLIWEFSQRPQTTIRDVDDVIQRFNALQRPTTKVNAVATQEVTELKAQVAEQVELLRALVTSQTTLQQQLSSAYWPGTTQCHQPRPERVDHHRPDDHCRR